jgi:hypothetical protein
MTHTNPGKPSTVDKAHGATEKVDKHQGPHQSAPSTTPEQPVTIKDEKLPDPMKPDVSKD